MKKGQLLQKYNSLSVQARAAFWFTMCSFLQKGISFITVPIFTRLMSTEQYGTYSVYLSWLQVFTVLSSLYLYHGVTDNAMSKFEDDRDRFIASMQGLTVTITTLVAVILFLSWNGVKKLIGLAPVMIFLMFAEIYVTPALAFWSAKQRFEYKYRKIAAVTLVKSFLNPCLGLLAVSLSEEKDLARVISTVTVEVLICGTILVLQFMRGKVFFHYQYWRYGLMLAVPMLPHYLSGIILNQGDRIVISQLVGKSAVALYGVAYSIGMLVQLFVSAINNALTPWIYSKLRTEDIEAIQKRSRGVILFVFLVAVGLMLISPEVVRIFGSEKYAQSVYVVPPVAGSVFFVFLYGFLSFPEFYYEKTSFLMIASIIAAALNILLNFIFIPKYGFVAAAYTTLACYVIYSFGHYLVGKTILKKKTGKGPMVDQLYTLILALAIIPISLLAQCLFDLPFIRYILIVSGMAVAVLKRGAILRLFTDK
ncbi:MAG: oligosaccharide flippase family protein [Lachnospiraceae bacterium]|nr:oligosaccharide flippase family protein [Lachnospiraceae bacterium]